MPDKQLKCDECGASNLCAAFMCDVSMKTYCQNCWSGTDCAGGKHEEGCATSVFTDGVDEQFMEAHDLRIMLNDHRQRIAELEAQNSQLIEPPASIKFHDHDGREREIVYEQGDWDVGIPSGYRISENDTVGDEVELAIAQLASVAQETRRLNSDSALGRGCGVHDLADKSEGALKVLREALGVE